MRRGLALLAALSAVALAACGKGGSKAPSTADFRRQADAICARYEQKLNALGKPASAAELSNFVDEAVPLIEQGDAELKRLEPPDKFKADWTRAMQLQDTNLQTTRRLRDAVHKQDLADVQSLIAQLDATNEESNRLAQKMGLVKCGTG